MADVGLLSRLAEAVGWMDGHVATFEVNFDVRVLTIQNTSISYEISGTTAKKKSFSKFTVQVRGRLNNSKPLQKPQAPAYYRCLGSNILQKRDSIARRVALDCSRWLLPWSAWTDWARRSSDCWNNNSSRIIHSYYSETKCHGVIYFAFPYRLEQQDKMNCRYIKVYARIRLGDVEDNLARVGSIGDWCPIEHVRCRVEGATMTMFKIKYSKPSRAVSMRRLDKI